MTIHLTHGNLLKQDDVDAIVNTVNCVGVMGKGIALQFKNKWPANFAAYQAPCKAGEVRPGKMMVFDAGAYAQPHFIINFPTKDHWRGSSRLSFVEDGLRDLVERINALSIRSIAIPPLGHWVAKHDDGVDSPDAALLAIGKWSTRKKKLMQPTHVHAAWNRLVQQGWMLSADTARGDSRQAD